MNRGQPIQEFHNSNANVLFHRMERNKRHDSDEPFRHNVILHDKLFQHTTFHQNLYDQPLLLHVGYVRWNSEPIGILADIISENNVPKLIGDDTRLTSN